MILSVFYAIFISVYDPNKEFTMTEKYKIYISEEMRSRLFNDAELFEFLKKDGSVNLNGYLKEVLVNYFDSYRKHKEDLLVSIIKDLGAFPSVDGNDAVLIAGRIINSYMKQSDMYDDRSSAVTLTLSGSSLDVMHTIENNMLSDCSLSQYVHDLFSSYLSYSRSRRERIAFSDVFKELEDAIDKKAVVTFSSSSADGRKFTVEPYLIASSKEEQCNYLLCADTGTHQPRTFRISRIRALYMTSERFVPDEKTEARLKEAAVKSPQSVYRNVSAKVFLTDQGIQKYRLITKNRPPVSKKEGSIYFFDWPKREIEDYFRRFGRDAIILSPADSRESLRYFYMKALSAYSKPDITLAGSADGGPSKDQ